MLKRMLHIKLLAQFNSLKSIRTLSAVNKNSCNGDQSLAKTVSPKSTDDQRRDVLSRTRIVSKEDDSAAIVKSIISMGEPVAVDTEVSAIFNFQILDNANFNLLR